MIWRLVARPSRGLPRDFWTFKEYVLLETSGSFDPNWQDQPLSLSSDQIQRIRDYSLKEGDIKKHTWWVDRWPGGSEEVYARYARAVEACPELDGKPASTINATLRSLGL